MKGCDVLIPVCTDAMTKEGRELIALGFGGLDSGWVWSLGLLKLTVLMGLCIGCCFSLKTDPPFSFKIDPPVD